MKKCIFVVVVLWLAAGLAFGGIIVKSPKAGDVWTTGEKYTITWTKSGCADPNIKINIFRNSIDQANFVEQLTCTGCSSKDWTIPGSYSSGNYQIRVKTADNVCVGDSGIFNIRKPLELTPMIKNPELNKKLVINPGDLLVKIQVTDPVEGGKYEGDQPLTIQWIQNFAPTSGTQVKISLHNAQNMNKLEDISTLTANDGSFSWTPSTTKYSWPGTKFYIKIVTKDNLFSGKSGVFTIFAPATELPEPPAPPKNKTIARSPDIQNKQTSSVSNSGEPECLSMGQSQPGRWAEPLEMKTGHWKHKSKGVKCGWAMEEYYFFSLLDFDISPARGKEIVRAELLISLSGTETNYGSLTEATNAFCNSSSRIFYNNALQKTFTLFEQGDQAKVDLLPSVKAWAVSGTTAPFSIRVSGTFDSVTSENTTCLRYYKGMILFVEYKE